QRDGVLPAAADRGASAFWAEHEASFGEQVEALFRAALDGQRLVAVVHCADAGPPLDLPGDPVAAWPMLEGEMTAAFEVARAFGRALHVTREGALALVTGGRAADDPGGEVVAGTLAAMAGVLHLELGRYGGRVTSIAAL